jgi:succinate dehydrogenase / fumarate reductase flavoprotein subunit
MSKLDSKIPEGPIDQKWTKYKSTIPLVNPANKRHLEVIVVGSGLAGSSAAATLAEMGYSVKVFCFQDSARRAHSIAAQGGINAAKNYQNDGDSVYRLFYDTIKGGDYRAREGNVHRLAEVSGSIIDQCVAQGVPFAREYGGLLSNRSFGGTQVQRTFYAAGQTGQQLLLGAYSGLNRQIGLGNVKMHARHEMLDIVNIDGKCRGIIARDLVTGKLERHFGHAVLLCTGGYGNVFYLSTNAMGSNVTAAWKAHKRGALFANPCYTQIHPTCIPVSGDHQSKLTLMSESLRNDGRIWVPKKKEDVEAIRAGKKKGSDIPEEDREKAMEAAGAEAGGGMDMGGGGMDMGGGAPPPPAGGGEEPLSESTLAKKSKKSKILGMLGEEKEDFNILFDMEKAQQNIYEIETKINDILND